MSDKDKKPNRDAFTDRKAIWKRNSNENGRS